MEGKLKKTACLLLAAIMFLGIFGCSGSVTDEGEGIIDIVYAEPTPDADQTQGVQTPEVENTPPSRDVTYMWLTNEMNVDAPNRPYPSPKQNRQAPRTPRRHCLRCFRPPHAKGREGFLHVRSTSSRCPYP